MENERDRLIRTTAYLIWEEGGRQEGGADGDWAEAERRVSASVASGAPPQSTATPSAKASKAAVPTPAPKPPRTAPKGRAKGGGSGPT